MNTSTAMAEHTMHALWEHTEAGHLAVELALLRSFGHDSDAIDFALNPDSYYFPNVDGDRLIKPTSVDEDKIPVVSLQSGKEYHFENPRLHRLQSIALERAGVSADIIKIATDYFANDNGTLTTSGGWHGTASLYHPPATVRQVPKQYIRPGPLMIFNIDPPTHRQDEDGASVALHEIVHIVQTLSSPVESPDNALNKELQAYGVQAKLVDNFQVPYTPSTAAAGEVDNFRIYNLGEGVYEATPEFVEAFNKVDIFARIVKSVS